MKTTTEIKIRGYHLDGYQHVNNARYLEFMEEARWDYLDKVNALGYFSSKNLAFVIVNINIDFKWPAKQGETISIETHLANAGNTSFIFEQIINNVDEGRVTALAKVTFVLLDQTSGKPIRVSDEARNLLSGETSNT